MQFWCGCPFFFLVSAKSDVNQVMNCVWVTQRERSNDSDKWVPLSGRRSHRNVKRNFIRRCLMWAVPLCDIKVTPIVNHFYYQQQEVVGLWMAREWLEFSNSHGNQRRNIKDINAPGMVMALIERSQQWLQCPYSLTSTFLSVFGTTNISICIRSGESCL